MGVNVAAFLAGGLMQGVGQGIVKQAEDARENALKMLAVVQGEQKMRADRSNLEYRVTHEDDRAADANISRYMTGQQAGRDRIKAAGVTADASRDNTNARIKEAGLGRTQTINAENERARLGREAAADRPTSTFQGENGNMWAVLGKGAPVDLGVPFNTKDQLTPSVDKEGRLGVLNKTTNVFTAAKDSATGKTVEARPQAQNALMQTLQMLDGGNAAPATTPPAGPAPGLVNTPPGAAPAAPAIAPAATPGTVAAPPTAASAAASTDGPTLAPADPKTRTVGTKYKNSSGKTATWTANGWLPD